jgi:hypothetical protein
MRQSAAWAKQFSFAAPLLGFFGLASNKEHDDGIDWSDHRTGGQPKNPGPKI